MKFLIDGSVSRLAARKEEWPEKFLGQLLTPLTGYKKSEKIFAIDNGAYSNFDETRFKNLLNRNMQFKEDCLFVAIPDKVGDHYETLKLFDKYKYLADGWKIAFVAQDGCNYFPTDIDSLFIGGTDNFKDSINAYNLVGKAISKGLHVHVGRVNNYLRFKTYEDLGAHTCDGSGISRYDHMLVRLKELYESDYYSG